MLFFDLKISAAETHQLLSESYGDDAPSYSNYRFWFQRSKSNDFDVSDKKQPVGPTTFEHNEMQNLLAENPALTLRELSSSLAAGKSTISRLLHAMKKVRKKRKRLPR